MTRSIIMVLAGACSYGILSTFVKLAYRQGYTAAEISFSQALVGMVALWALFLLRPENRRAVRNGLFGGAASLPGLFSGATIGLTTFVYYRAVEHIAASLAIVILMQFTWVGMLLDWLLFGRKPTLRQVATAAVILAGTWLASGIDLTQPLKISSVGMLYAVGAALLYAVYVVANSRLNDRMPRAAQGALLMTGSSLGIFMVNAPQLITSRHFGLPLLPWALFLAWFGTIIPPVLFARSIPVVGAGVSAILMTAELPVAVACSSLVLGEPVTARQWLGVVIMLAAMAMLHTRRPAASHKPQAAGAVVK